VASGPDQGRRAAVLARPPRLGSRPERIAEDRAALTAAVPDDFWREMREQRLIAADAPLPIDRR
jgi:hypothetical protein